MKEAEDSERGPMKSGATAPGKGWVSALWAAFSVQVAGRLIDLQWHRTHDEFETGSDQIQAHWLVWLGTILVAAVCVIALRVGPGRAERIGYQVTLIANALYALVAVVHFIQHLDHQEVDWTHVALAVTNAVAVIGVVGITIARLKSTSSPEVAAP